MVYSHISFVALLFSSSPSSYVLKYENLTKEMSVLHSDVQKKDLLEEIEKMRPNAGLNKPIR